jgi:CheY-like chemotaxis protein
MRRPDLIMSNVTTVTDEKAGHLAGAVVRPLRVLIVDDNKPFAETLSWVLEGGGNTIEIAHNGPDALSIAARLDPDVVFLDIILPVMDGYEVCKRLRAQSRNPNLKIVAQSGYSDTAAEAEKRGAGFDAHLTKPLDVRQVVSLLSEIRWGRL